MNLTVSIVAPTGRDADLLIMAMKQNGIAAEALESLDSIFHDNHQNPIGPLFIAEEALTPHLTNELHQYVRNQPSWSDLPILIARRMSGSREALPLGEQILSFGLPVYLERPLKTSTLISSVKAALRARKRQYENRDALRDRDEAVRELHREREALIRSEKLAAVGRLAASISHEINNPLEAVMNLLYITRSSPELTDETRDLLDQADEELKRVSQIVSHTLRFHRQATNPRPIIAEELLEPTLGIFRGRLMNSQIEVVIDHRSDKTILCREGDIRQVLNNLIGNAIDAMRAGGKLSIRTSLSKFWRHSSGPVDGLRITIADSGHGIDPETRKTLFEPFFTTKGINGTGLGLWISHNIVDKHQGLFQVRSSTKPGSSGTAFSLLLPLKPTL